MHVTELDLRKQVRRLREVFPTSKSEDDLVQAFRFVFNGEKVTVPDVSAAVSRLAKTDKRFMPTPGQVLTVAKTIRSESGGWKPEGSKVDLSGETPCPACGAKVRLLQPDEQVRFGWDERDGRYVDMSAKPAPGAPARYGVLHDVRKHAEYNRSRRPEDRVPCVGYWR